MRLLMIVAMLALLAGPSVVRAADGPHGEGYVEIEAGLVIPSDSSSTPAEIVYAVSYTHLTLPTNREV